MLAWQKWGNGETPESSGLKGDHLVGKYYVIFDKEYKAGIWMKDMNFPIDIYWFKKDLSPDLVLRDISPDTYPNVFYPQGDVLYVLETKVDYVLDKALDLDLTYINKHDKNIKILW
jgi:uncharacterized membrane protein (UPF0127 family)